MANCFNLLPSRDQWPVGFRFYPTDEELINHYLKNKVFGDKSLVAYIRHIDVCKYEPWDLPRLLNDHAGIDKWFFFSALDFKYSNSNRPNRITKAGFWKSTGNDRKIMARETNELIGTKKTLVFHRGRAREANRTNWVIHEYRLHKDTSFANLKPFVICRLKKKSDMNVSKFDEPNGLVNSTFENVSTANGIQEALGYDFSHCTGQPALPDSQSINASDGGVNRQSRPREATEQYFDLLELLNRCSSPQQPAFPELLNSDDQPMDASDEYFDDATTSKPRSEPEPALWDFQFVNGNDGEIDPIDFLNYFVEDVNYDGEVNNQQLRPGASECEFNDCLNSIRDCDEVTSRICNDSHNKEALNSMGLEFQDGGFCSNTNSDAAIVWQKNSFPSSCFHNYTSSSMQNMPTIKESGGSYPPVRGLKYVVSCGSAIKTVRLKREIRSKAISQDKAKEDEKRLEVASSPQLSITDSNDGLKSEAGSKATNCGVSCCGSIVPAFCGIPPKPSSSMSSCQLSLQRKRDR